MERKFIVEGYEKKKIITPEGGGPYSLTVWQCLSEAINVTLWNQQMKCMITGRTLEEYGKIRLWFDEMEECRNEGKTIIEVGGGLSQFTPFLSTIEHPHNERPILIDPLDYEMAEALLTEAIAQAERGDESFSANLDRITSMLESCKVIRDTTRVELINCTLGEALQRRPDLLKKADVVVDIYGPMEYAHTEKGCEAIWETEQYNEILKTVLVMQRQLLKENGLLITNRSFS